MPQAKVYEIPTLHTMSGAASRPRPRPRPKPVQKTAEPASSAASSSGSVSQSKQSQNDDDDAMFIRQPRKNESTWELLEKKNRENSKSQQTIVSSDSDEDVGTPRRRAKKRKGNDGVSGWQNKKDLKRFMSQGLSDSDSDVQILEDKTPRGKNSKAGRQEKRKRSRSRSRSITPPPQIPQSRLETLRNVVREALGVVRPESPTYLDSEDDSTDLILDPELQRIVQNARLQPRDRSQSRFSSPLLAGGGDKVMVTVKWQPHPLNQHGKETTWTYSINRSDNFRQVFDAVAEEACVISENLVLTYRGDRFFPSVSPTTLHMYNEATIVACDKRAWDYMRANRKARSSPPSPSVSPSKLPLKSSSLASMSIPEDKPIEFISSSGDEFEYMESGHQDESDDSGGGGGTEVEENDIVPEDTFTLTVRSGSANKGVTLVVRPTAKCGAIVKGFLKKSGLADQYPAFMNGETQLPAGKNTRKKGGTPPQKMPVLSIDGDRVGNDEEIGQYDLEDGDMVEVVGL
ncbi:hypothetical protein E1B28_012228 [Marasmius oreades]|uniref:Rad60/SUMO-like domain-containing protein n=1 Tax=Marasmius oreades TaxID=181124 RepID=A0A9P7RR11_9AGAR|nr:uncharacterized protein E1B28_012228 [Marasmius oreades]KAG7088211.1 hypothetical protein E1B28_012228 [Marasmius oreades]